MKNYQKAYGVSKEQMDVNFLLLPSTEFNPFITECAIYNGSSANPIACASPALEDNNDVIKYSPASTAEMAKSFKAIWRRYKRANP